jgi:DNA polymerase-3 subunit gamma/tau
MILVGTRASPVEGGCTALAYHCPVPPADSFKDLSRIDSPQPHVALYRRWRAQTFAQIVGQGPVVETLRNAVRLDRVAHGLLFVGPRGTGKTSMARIVAKAINCAQPRDGEPCDVCEACVAIREGRAFDVVEMDAASNNRVDDMRELLPRVYTAAADVRRKVFIVDEVQRIKEGWDVLLKTLEEPPPDVVFIFCTTNPAQIRPAVISRLQRFTFRPLSVEEISGKLQRILDEDGRSAEPDAVRLVAEMAAGGMRDAESMLDQLLGGAGEVLTADSVRELLGLADEAAVETFIAALAGSDPAAGIAVLDDLEANGRDLVAFADQVVARLRRVLVEALATNRSREEIAGLARAARRLAGLDSNRAGAGGYRFQLELALLQGGEAAPPIQEAVEIAPTRPERVAPTRPTPSRPPVESNSQAQPSPTPTPEPQVQPPPIPTTEPESPPGIAVAPAAERVAVADDGADPLQRLRRAWPEVVAAVARNPANRPLITVCRPLAVEGNTVILGFPEDQAFLRDIAERKRSALEDGVRGVLGPEFAVRCVAANVEALAEAMDDEAQQIMEQARRVFEGDLADVAEIR